jgi:hypothetical protein
LHLELTASLAGVQPSLVVPGVLTRPREIGPAELEAFVCTRVLHTRQLDAIVV